MGLFGPSKNELQSEIDRLKSENDRLANLLTPELSIIGNQKIQIESLKRELESLSSQETQKKDEISSLDAEIELKRQELRVIDDALLIEEFGLYEPQFDFANSSQYKDALSDVRKEQKDEVQKINRMAKNTHWIVDNNAAKGRQMVGQTTRLLLRAYNSECDEIIRKVKFSNIDRSIEQIQKAADTISKLGSVLGISITAKYVNLKKKEARLAYEYAVAKEKEKEEIRAAKELEREERRVQKEIEEKRKALVKEQKKYQQALDDARKQLSSASGDDKVALEEKIAELTGNLGEVAKGIEDVDYREANIRSGYVYIISNVGSFGDGVYKIGMTRRLEPMDRIRELGDASVPFGFDVHALIFSDDAPSLETALHHEFAERKLNLVNQRREFFRCSLDEIKEAVLKNYDKTVEFVDFPDAEQYRTSEKMRESTSDRSM